jgi:hypothetical protein
MYADVKTAQRSQPNSAEKTPTMLQTKKPKTTHDLIMLCVVWRAAKNIVTVLHERQTQKHRKRQKNNTNTNKQATTQTGT